MTDALDQFLSGMKPELNETIEPLKGVYRVVIKNEEKAETGFIISKFPNGDESRRFQITCDVTDVLQGNGNAGRRLWLRYNEDEKGVQKLINDLFTAGLLEKVTRDTVDSLKATLPEIAGVTGIVKAWFWLPEKDRAGNPVAEADRKAIQQGQFVTEKSVAKLLAKTSATPF